jgi:DeoR family fructose operon transcriptional repressor
MNRAAAERREEILRRLVASGFVGASDLARDLDVSEMTIRRDLLSMAGDGLGRRVRGGLGLPAGALAESGIELGLPFEARSAERAETKRRLAEATATLLGELDGRLVALDAGTTIAPLAALLPAGRTVVSHSVPVITACSRRDDLELVGLGGDYQPQTRSFGGPATRAALDDLAIDLAVLSATAVSANGTWSTNSVDADTKRSLATAAETVVLVVDASKLDGRGPVRAVDLSKIDILVTESPVDPAAETWLGDAGIRIVAVEPG